MKIAILDLGTNSIRFDVHQIGPGGAPKCIFSDKVMVRLGRELFLTGSISFEALDRALIPLRDYARVVEQLGVTRVVAVATAALRLAANRAEIVEQIRRETEFLFEVISGAEEAQLIAEGILAQERELPADLVFIDIGGGSTEVSLVKEREVFFSTSLGVGAAQLQQVHLKTSPPTEDNLAGARLALRKTFDVSFQGVILPARSFLIGSSGSIRSVASLERKPGEDQSMFSLEHVRGLVSRMEKCSRDELLLISGMEENRVDLIVAGALILEELMIYLRVVEGRATKFSLRHGLLARELARL